MSQTVKNASFHSVPVPLDGADFEGCVFEHCLLVYGGGELPRFTDCVVQDCTWRFEAAAERTVGLIRAVARSMGPVDGKVFVERVFLDSWAPPPAADKADESSP